MYKRQIISNPPYIDEEEMRSLEPQVRRFEPHLALFGGKDGLDVYRRLIPDCRRCLSPGGWLGVEIGYAQGRAVRELMQTYGYGNVKVLTDMEHRDRVVIGCRGEGERNDRPLEKNQSAL